PHSTSGPTTTTASATPPSASTRACKRPSPATARPASPLRSAYVVESASRPLDHGASRQLTGLPKRSTETRPVLHRWCAAANPSDARGHGRSRHLGGRRFLLASSLGAESSTPTRPLRGRTRRPEFRSPAAKTPLRRKAAGSNAVDAATADNLRLRHQD